MTGSLLAVVIAYLLGSIPFGFWIGRMMGHDLRVEGSGNTGATNALRVLGREVGILVMVLDIAKGTLAVVIGSQLGGTGTEVLAATAAVLGHAFPVFLRFRGGKAVATGAGAMLGLAPITAVIAFTVWIAVIALTRYVSVASLIAATLFPILAVAFGSPWPVIAFTLAAASFVFWRHRANIARLRAGTESRLSLRGAP
jgi:glycerol-3-phosphate acyltransferase PlsY